MQGSPVNGHWETWAISGLKAFAGGYAMNFINPRKKAPQSETVSSAMKVLEAKALV